MCCCYPLLCDSYTVGKKIVSLSHSLTRMGLVKSIEICHPGQKKTSLGNEDIVKYSSKASSATGASKVHSSRAGVTNIRTLPSLRKVCLFHAQENWIFSKRYLHHPRAGTRKIVQQIFYVAF